MIRIILNIGYKYDENSSILNDFPMSWEFTDISECFAWLRSQMFIILTWAHSSHIQKDRLCLFMRLENDDEYWEYKVWCKNIREYKLIMDLSDEEIEAMKRGLKIDEVLD